MTLLLFPVIYISMKNKTLFLLLLSSLLFGSSVLYARSINGCQLDPLTGNRYCYRSVASRYSQGRVDYSTHNNYQDTSDFYKTNQVCPLHSHFEKFPINACVCNSGYEVSRDKVSCVQKKEPLSLEASRVLLKAISGKPLTQKEKQQKGAIQRWINEVFSSSNNGFYNEVPYNARSQF